MTQNTLWNPSDIGNTDGATEGSEQESPKRRGRIPQSAWPQILERHRAGATLSAIAREFECTPSAISYIVRKAEASGQLGGDEAGVPAAAPVEEPAPAPEPAPAAAPAPAPAAEPPQAEAPAPAPQPAPRRQAEAKPAGDAPRARLELKREEPRPAPAAAPTPAPAPAAAPAPVAPAAAAAPADAQAPRPAGARAEPTPPVDEVEARLRETARGCLAAYRTWRQQPGQGSIQTLSDAVHDLRKALARIEIDMSASRRDEQVARPIPIPNHRAARRPQ